MNKYERLDGFLKGLDELQERARDSRERGDFAAAERDEEALRGSINGVKDWCKRHGVTLD